MVYCMKPGVFILIFTLTLFVQDLYAVEKAERISDREIIESLAEIKADIKGMDERFKAMDKRMESLETSLNRRMDDLNRRIDDVMSLLQILIGVLSVIGAGIFGTLLLMWRKITRLEQIADEVAFLKDVYLRLQEQVTYLLKPTKSPL